MVEVRLHIYDLTRGMAQVMSAALLGNKKHITVHDDIVIISLCAEAH